MVKWAIAIHGGAGEIPYDLPPAQRIPRVAALRRIIYLGIEAMKAHKAPLDVVELIVRELEDCEHFNSGKGSVLTTNGTVLMDACIMDGKTRQVGAVSGLSTVAHPVSLARLVMERTPHVYLGFEGAEAFAREQGAEIKDDLYFITPENVVRLKQAKELNQVQLYFTPPLIPTIGSNTSVPSIEDLKKKLPAAAANGRAPNLHFAIPTTSKDDVNKRPQPPLANGFNLRGVVPILVDDNSQIGTVGCVVVDCDGNLAAATSTGGLVNKMIGRIGDSPVVGAGTYANKFCAVSVTGHGEESIRSTVGRSVAAVMEHRKLSLKEAAARVMADIPINSLGFISVSAEGEVEMPFNTFGMFRACATQDGRIEVDIW